MLPGSFISTTFNMISYVTVNLFCALVRIVLNAAVGPKETAVISYSVGGAIATIFIAIAVYVLYSRGGAGAAGGAPAAPTRWRLVSGNLVSQDRPFFGITPRFSDVRPWRMMTSPNPVFNVGAANPMARAGGSRLDAVNRLTRGNSQPSHFNMRPWRLGQNGDPANVRLYWRPRSGVGADYVAPRPVLPLTGPVITRPPVAGLPTAGLNPLRIGFGQAPWAMPRYTGVDAVQPGFNSRFQGSNDGRLRSPPRPPVQRTRLNPLPNIVSCNCR
jgi:hypothetical protein